MVRIVDTTKKYGKWKKRFAILPKKFITSDSVIHIWLSSYQVRYYFRKPDCKYYLDRHTIKINEKIYIVLND